MKKMTMLRLGGCLPLIILLGILLPSAASAAVRYAAPGASGGCTSVADACSLKDAIDFASNNDQIVVTPGHYVPGSELDIDNSGLDVGGQAGMPQPQIDGSAIAGQYGIQVRNTAVGVNLHDLRLDEPATGLGALRTASAAAGADNFTGERLYISSASTSSARACDLSGGSATLRDSLCRGGGPGLNIDISGGAAKGVTLRNVTAISGPGWDAIDIGAGGAGSSVTVDGVNVIAHQGGGGHGDIGAESFAGGTSTVVTLSHSNYATRYVPNPATDSVTAPGTNGNQTAPPLFANPAAGDFHELAGSPTIDAGTSDPLMGSFDLDHNARTAPSCVGGTAGIPDIGAYEAPTISPPLTECGKFTLGALKRNKKKGTAKLTVTVPGSGALSLSGKGLKKSSVTAGSAGNDTLTLKAKGKAKHKLAAKGKIKLKATITFTPTGGTANTQTAKLKLKEKKR